MWLFSFLNSGFWIMCSILIGPRRRFVALSLCRISSLRDSGKIKIEKKSNTIWNSENINTLLFSPSLRSIVRLSLAGPNKYAPVISIVCTFYGNIHIIETPHFFTYYIFWIWKQLPVISCHLQMTTYFLSFINDNIFPVIYKWQKYWVIYFNFNEIMLLWTLKRLCDVL